MDHIDQIKMLQDQVNWYKAVSDKKLSGVTDEGKPFSQYLKFNQQETSESNDNKQSFKNYLQNKQKPKREVSKTPEMMGQHRY